MNKSNLIKKFFILVITLMCVVFTCNFVYAADEEDDFTDLLSNNTSNNNTNTNNNNTNTNNNTLNTNLITTTNNSTNKTNTSLPKTGLNDMMPVTLLVVVFGISAVYAYKKVKEYQNI